MTKCLSLITERILDELQRRFDERGHGARAEVQRKLGVSDKFFRRWEKGEVRIDLGRLERTLEALDVDPVEFFCQAFECSVAEAPTEGLSGLALAAYNASISGEGEVREPPPLWFLKLERRRYEDPGSVFLQAEQVLDRLEASELGYFCAVFGDVLRAIGRYHEGQQLLEVGLRLIPPYADLHLSLLQRQAALFRRDPRVRLCV